MKRLRLYINMVCITILAMLSSACERETWLSEVEEAAGTGDPVEVMISYEMPTSDLVVSTRTMSPRDQHDLRDLYVLVFSEPDDASKINDPKEWKRVYANTSGTPDPTLSFFSREMLSDMHTYNEDEDITWSSVLDNATPTSTHGTLRVRALDKNCLIIAVANVVDGEDNGQGAGSLYANLNRVDNADDLYALKANLHVDTQLDRDNMKMLMSGVFISTADKDKYEENFTPLTAGKVNVAAYRKSSEGIVDLTSAGVIKLRRLSSHISFELTINSDVFKDFQPESWQVVHVPQRSWLIDLGDNSIPLVDDGDADKEFLNSDLQTTMLHSEGIYKFDFFMFENRKNDRTTTDAWYLQNYGQSISSTTQPNGSTSCLMLGKYRNINKGTELFKYAKRELELKYTSGDHMGEVIWNDPDADHPEQKSKNFVYVEPNATYVVIKGRLLLKEDVTMTELITNTLSEKKASYADVTYVIHLGYARDRNIKDQMERRGGSVDYKMKDFNSLRNTEYVYKVQIQGVNSIYTHVEAEEDGVESTKLMPGASGFLGMATDKLYNTDCHYNTFVISLNKKQIENFFYEVNTNWNSEINADNVTAVNYTTLFKNNPDFTWIKFRYNGYIKNETTHLGTDLTTIDDQITDVNQVQRYKIQGNDIYNNKLWDLYDLKTFVAAQNEARTWKGDVFTEDDLVDYDVYFSVYLDEYFYASPPQVYDKNSNTITPAWTGAANTQWHEFVNKPDRYVSFGNNKSEFTVDGSSSKIDPEVIIVQHSIQTFYSIDSPNGMGVENYNETKNPRWTETTNPIPVPSSSVKYDSGNGWKNCKPYLTLDGGWATYVDNTVNTEFNNVNMKPSGITEVSPKDVDDDTDNIYLASAIRLCMNRNRDEDGNGKIDSDELKWYLPSSEQLDYIAMCHFSLYNPLLNINELYDESTMRDDTYGNKYIVLPEMPVERGYNAGQNGNLYTARTFVSSDYKKVATQEMINTKDYNFNNASSKPQEMRCVRNLGISDPETVAPDDIYQYNNYRFDMQHLDSRSLRSSMVTDEELDPNTFYSENNRPYKAFKVAKTIEYIRKNTHGFAANIYLHKALTTDINPCRTHVEDEDNG